MPRIKHPDIPETVVLFIINLLKMSVRFNIKWIQECVEKQFDWEVTREQVIYIAEEMQRLRIPMNWEGGFGGGDGSGGVPFGEG
jgi:hypothetical protein